MKHPCSLVVLSQSMSKSYAELHTLFHFKWKPCGTISYTIHHIWYNIYQHLFILLIDPVEHLMFYLVLLRMRMRDVIHFSADCRMNILVYNENSTGYLQVNNISQLLRPSHNIRCCLWPIITYSVTLTILDVMSEACCFWKLKPWTGLTDKKENAVGLSYWW